MKILTPKQSKLIMLTQHEAAIMNQYLSDCYYKGFTGINNFEKINDAREFFFRWHLAEIQKKFNKTRRKEMTYVTLNLPELKTMQAMFRRVDCNDEAIALQKKFYYC